MLDTPTRPKAKRTVAQWQADERFQSRARQESRFCRMLEIARIANRLDQGRSGKRRFSVYICPELLLRVVAEALDNREPITRGAIKRCRLDLADHRQAPRRFYLAEDVRDSICVKGVTTHHILAVTFAVNAREDRYSAIMIPVRARANDSSYEYIPPRL